MNFENKCLREVIFNELVRYDKQVWSTDGIMEYDELADTLTAQVDAFVKYHADEVVRWLTHEKEEELKWKNKLG